MTTLTAPEAMADLVDLAVDVPCGWWDGCAVPAVWIGTAVDHPHPDRQTMCRRHKRETDRYMRLGGMECMTCGGRVERVTWELL